jgi:DNA-binding transcriptional LysR family regulator
MAILLLLLFRCAQFSRLTGDKVDVRAGICQIDTHNAEYSADEFWRSMTLSNIDLNLLKVLDVLLAERSVTRAGKRLGRSQPAVSNALQRLRNLLKDELLVRGPEGFVLTPRAEAIRVPLRNALHVVESCVSQKPRFDPAEATGVFRLSMPDRLSLALIPDLLDRMQRLAPGMTLQVTTADRSQALELIDADRVDLALGWFDERRPHLKFEILLQEDLFCVVRRGHPLLRRHAKYDIQSVLAFPHLVVSATGNWRAIFDELLSREGLQRRALVAVTNFTVVPHLLGRSDMIGVFTRYAAKVFEETFGLMTRPLPIGISIETAMVWQLRYDNDRKFEWLRQQVSAVCRHIAAGARQRQAS